MTQDVVQRSSAPSVQAVSPRCAERVARLRRALRRRGQLDPKTPNEEIANALGEAYLRLDAFRDLKITLITGAANPLWHRESIDRMAEWLARRGEPATKHVLAGYGHQDLWWGKRSWDEVFPLVLQAVRP